MHRRIRHTDRAHQPELRLYEQILQNVLRDSRHGPVHAERSGAVAHRVKLKITERNLFHLTIGRMIVDPVFVTAKCVAWIEHGCMLVGNAGQLIEPSTG